MSLPRLANEVIANVVSFVSTDVNIISMILVESGWISSFSSSYYMSSSPSIPSTPISSKVGSKSMNDNNDEDAVFRALCLLRWSSCGGGNSTSKYDGLASSSSSPPSPLLSYIQHDESSASAGKSWKILYRVLNKWTDRQGYYTILEAAPWGLLLRLRFGGQDGKSLVGDVLFPSSTANNNDDEDYDIQEDHRTLFCPTRIFELPLFEQLEAEIESDDDNIDSKISCCNRRTYADTSFFAGMVCGTHYDGPVVLEPYKVNTSDKSSRSSHACPNMVQSHVQAKISTKPGRERGINNFDECLVLHTTSLEKEATNMLLFMQMKVRLVTTHRDKLEQIRLAWETTSSVEPFEMVQALWDLSTKLTLDRVGCCYRLDQKDTNTYKDCNSWRRPIRPGLYSGIYENMYGKFKREIILVEYLQYNFKYASNGEEGDTDSIDDFQCWNEIRSVVFNAPEQNDGERFFRTLQEIVRKKKIETVIFLIGTKVTGDCHVPMKKISFGGLIYPEINDIFPSSNENRSREGRDGGVTLTTTAFPRINPAVTDFMNDGTYHRVLQSWPGWGTLSYQDFVRPHWARAEIVDVASSNSHQESAFSRMPTVAPTVSNTITATKQDGSSSSSDPKEVFGMVWNRHSAIILTRMEEEKR